MYYNRVPITFYYILLHYTTLLQPKVAHYYVFGKCVYGRPAGPARPNAFWERFLGNALRMMGVGCELESETRGIDVTRRAESIGEGIRV